MHGWSLRGMSNKGDLLKLSAQGRASGSNLPVLAYVCQSWARPRPEACLLLMSAVRERRVVEQPPGTETQTTEAFGSWLSNE